MAARDAAARHESPQVRAPAVAWTFAAILVVLAAIAIGLALIFPERIGLTRVHGAAFPSPGVTANERQQRLALEARQRAELAGGNGRMPIGRAMDAVAAKGAHAFDPVEAAP